MFVELKTANLVYEISTTISAGGVGTEINTMKNSDPALI